MIIVGAPGLPNTVPEDELFFPGVLMIPAQDEEEEEQTITTPLLQKRYKIKQRGSKITKKIY